MVAVPRHKFFSLTSLTILTFRVFDWRNHKLFSMSSFIIQVCLTTINLNVKENYDIIFKSVNNKLNALVKGNKLC